MVGTRVGRESFAVHRDASAALYHMVGMAEHRSAVQYQSIVKTLSERCSPSVPPQSLGMINWGTSLDHIGAGCACS